MASTEPLPDGLGKALAGVARPNAANVMILRPWRVTAQTSSDADGRLSLVVASESDDDEGGVVGGACGRQEFQQDYVGQLFGVSGAVAGEGVG